MFNSFGLGGGFGFAGGSGGSSGGGVDSSAQDGITAAGISDQTLIDNIDLFIKGLKVDGIWTAIVGLYLMVGGNAGAHAVNWKSPGTKNLTFNGAWVHSATGALPAGAISSYAQTGIIPSVDLLLNSVYMGYYSGSNVTGAPQMAMGVVNADATSFLQLSTGTTAQSGNGIANAGTSPLALSTGVTDTRKYFSIYRNDAGNNHHGINGQLNASAAAASTALAVTELIIGARSRTDLGTRDFPASQECRGAVVAHGLTAAQDAKMFARLHALNAGLGRAN